MKIALLGYGKEGKSTEEYFKSHFDAEIDVFTDFTREEISGRDFSSYDYVFRSPSVPPLKLANETSITKYFFDNCPCKIIGVTATKGKGTTCSFAKSLLDALGEKAFLVGNIGKPAIEVLDDLTPDSVVVYEMSSFQLWDLTKSPSVAVVGTIEPDHLNVHDGFDDYVNAKANICRFQAAEDYIIYYRDNADSVKIAENSPAKNRISYPFEIPEAIRAAVKLPGEHNVRNAMAAVAAVASYMDMDANDFMREHEAEVCIGLAGFKGLPHRLEFVREKDGILYYDDNFSTNPASTRVAVEAFPDKKVVMIVGGRDKTNNDDIPEIYEVISAPNVASIVLMGESGHEIARRYDDARFTVAESLEEAVKSASEIAGKLGEGAIVLMSPSAASFDMFKDVYDRGSQYQNLVNNL